MKKYVGAAINDDNHKVWHLSAEFNVLVLWAISQKKQNQK